MARGLADEVVVSTLFGSAEMASLIWMLWWVLVAQIVAGKQNTWGQTSSKRALVIWDGGLDVLVGSVQLLQYGVLNQLRYRLSQPVANFEFYSPCTLTYRPCKLMVGRWHFLLTWSLFSHRVYCNALCWTFFLVETCLRMFRMLDDWKRFKSYSRTCSDSRPLERFNVCFAPRVPADDFCVSTLWDMSPRSH